MWESKRSERRRKFWYFDVPKVCFLLFWFLLPSVNWTYKPIQNARKGEQQNFNFKKIEGGGAIPQTKSTGEGTCPLPPSPRGRRIFTWGKTLWASGKCCTFCLYIYGDRILMVAWSSFCWDVYRSGCMGVLYYYILYNIMVLCIFQITDLTLTHESRARSHHRLLWCSGM